MHHDPGVAFQPLKVQLVLWQNNEVEKTYKNIHLTAHTGG